MCFQKSLFKVKNELKNVVFIFRTLRRLKENLETEKLIMKDVEGWDATQSVYNTDRWVAPREFELEKL